MTVPESLSDIMSRYSNWYDVWSTPVLDLDSVPILFQADFSWLYCFLIKQDRSDLFSSISPSWFKNTVALSCSSENSGTCTFHVSTPMILGAVLSTRTVFDHECVKTFSLSSFITIESEYIPSRRICSSSVSLNSKCSTESFLAYWYAKVLL